jgi:hypothetical protein
VYVGYTFMPFPEDVWMWVSSLDHTTPFTLYASKRSLSTQVLFHVPFVFGALDVILTLKAADGTPADRCISFSRRAVLFVVFFRILR